MALVTESEVLAALKSVYDPDKDEDIVSLGMVSGLVVKDGNVGFSIEVEPERGQWLEPLRKEAEEAIEDLPGVLSVTVVLTADRPAEPPQHGSQQTPAPLVGEPQLCAAWRPDSVPATTTRTKTFSALHRGRSNAMRARFTETVPTSAATIASAIQRGLTRIAAQTRHAARPPAAAHT